MLVINPQIHLPDTCTRVNCTIVCQYNFNTSLKMDSEMTCWDSPSLSSLIFRSNVFSLTGLHSCFYCFPHELYSFCRASVATFFCSDTLLISVASYECWVASHTEKVPTRVKCSVWSFQNILQAAVVWWTSVGLYANADIDSDEDVHNENIVRSKGCFTLP